VAAVQRRVRRLGSVGIWHETYLVRDGEYETVYNNMPETGLGAAGTLVPATESGRLGRETDAAGDGSTTGPGRGE
jgi:hypothetical protein